MMLSCYESMAPEQLFKKMLCEFNSYDLVHSIDYDDSFC